MDSDEEEANAQQATRSYNAFRSDLSAALSAFDRAQDWADLAHDLQRVNRVLNKHTNTNTLLPEKLLLAKRLAQCLTSTLPSGVHLKTLETYHLVFKKIGQQKLEKDLPIYAVGLFPLLSYAATSLKPALLQLYETHIIPLGRSLRNVVEGLVLALLPGLEDETSECYDRTKKVLESVMNAIEDRELFFTAIWRALLLVPSCRFPAALFLKEHLLEGNTGKVCTDVVKDVSLVCYALSAGIKDSSTLTKRAALDLLVESLSLDQGLFEDEDNFDSIVTLVDGALKTLLQKDMSLNKRIYSWLLGGRTGEDGVAFCNKYSQKFIREILSRNVASAIEEANVDESNFLLPYAIINALLDREELAQCLAQYLCVTVLQYATAAFSTETEYLEKAKDRLAETLNQFNEERLCAGLQVVISSEKFQAESSCDLLGFVVSTAKGMEEVSHPRVTKMLLETTVETLKHIRTEFAAFDRALKFSLELLRLMNEEESPECSDDLASVAKKSADFLVAWLQEFVDKHPLSNGSVEKGRSKTTAEEKVACLIKTCCSACSVVAVCFSMAVRQSSVSSEVSKLSSDVLAIAQTCAASAFSAVSVCGAELYMEVMLQLPSGERDDLQTSKLIASIWRWLNGDLPSREKQGYIGMLMKLQKAFPALFHDLLSTSMLARDREYRLSGLAQFALLWNSCVGFNVEVRALQRSLFLMLDALVDEDTSVRMLARSWLAQTVTTDPSNVFDPLIEILLCHAGEGTEEQRGSNVCYDAPRVQFAFATLYNVVRGLSFSIEAVEALSSFSASKQTSGSRHRQVAEDALLREPSSTVKRIITSWATYLEGDVCSTRYRQAALLRKIALAKSYAQVFIFAALLHFLRWDTASLLERERAESNSAENESEFEDSDGILEFDFFTNAEKAVGICLAEFLSVLFSSVNLVNIGESKVTMNITKLILLALKESTVDCNELLQFHLLNAAKRTLSLKGVAQDNLHSIVVLGIRKAFAPSAGAATLHNTVLEVQRRWIDFTLHVVAASSPKELKLFRCLIILTTKLLKKHPSGSQQAELLLSGLCALYSTVLSKARIATTSASSPISAAPTSDMDVAGGNTTIAESSASASGTESFAGATPSTNLNLNPLKVFEYMKDALVGPTESTGDQQDPKRALCAEAFSLLPQLLVPLFRDSCENLSSARKFLVLNASYFTGDMVMSSVASDLDLVRLPNLSSEQIVSAVSLIVDRAITWKENGPAHQLFQRKLMVRDSCKRKVTKLLDCASTDTQEEELDIITSILAQEQKASVTSLIIYQDPASCGYFFVEHGHHKVLQKATKALELYFSVVGKGKASIPTWTSFLSLCKGIAGAEHAEPASIISVLDALRAFAENTDIFVDKKQMKDLLGIGSTLISWLNDFVAKNSITLRPPRDDDRSENANRRIENVSMVLKYLSCDVPEFLDLIPEIDQQSLASCIHSSLSLGGQIIRRSASRTAARRKVEAESKKETENQRPSITEEEFAAALLLRSYAKKDRFVKVVRREMLATIEDTAFFVGRSQDLLGAYSKAIKEVIFADGPGPILMSIGSGGSSSSTGISAVFALRASEVTLRTRLMQRLSFCVYSCDKGQCVSQLQLILERLRDALRMGVPSLTVASFLCLRILLLRMGSDSIAAFRATTLSEILRILSKPLRNLQETLASLQFLDLIILLKPPDFSYERCFFLPSHVAGDEEKDQPTSSSAAPLIKRLTSLPAEIAADEASARLQGAPSQLVFSGRLNSPPTQEFLVKFARSLEERNVSSQQCTATPDLISISDSIGEEFLE